MMTLTVGLASCGEPTPPSRLDAYTFTFEFLDDSLIVRDLVFHWPAERMPVRFWSNPDDSLTAYVEYAIQQWEAQFLYGEVSGIVVGDSAHADVILQASPSVPTAPLTGIPAIGLDPGCAGVTTPDSSSDDARQLIGPIRTRISWPFISTKTRADSLAQVRCLVRVITHEVGHSFGIFNFNHLGTDSTDIMYVFPRVAVPSERDRSTIQRLYHTHSDILAPVRPR